MLVQAYEPPKTSPEQLIISTISPYFILPAVLAFLASTGQQIVDPVHHALYDIEQTGHCSAQDMHSPEKE
jgi:hypothetical protein